MAAVDGTGVTVSVGLKTFPVIDTVSIGPFARESIEATTHLTTGEFLEYIPAQFVDGGTVTVPFQWAPGDDQTVADLAYGAAETITITFSDGGSLVFSGFVESISFENPFRARCTGSMTIRIAAEPSWSSGV